jgi:hypothetical protein
MPKRHSRNTQQAQYSLWLLPSGAHESLLLETVARLSVLLGGPSFTPHLTVLGDIALTLEQLRGPARHMAERCPPLRWKVNRVECTAAFFRCLYLRFDKRPEFALLQQCALHCSGTRRGLPPYPHLSLAYGDPHPDNAGLCTLLAEEFAGQAIVFDRLAICRSSSNVPIAQWECLEQFPLAAT